MSSDKRYLVDVELKNLPFPVIVESRSDKKGQNTVAHISVKARITREFEASCVNQIIKILHQHKDNIGPGQLSTNILDYMITLDAAMVQIDLKYPYFMEKVTPASKEKCLMSYTCTYSLKKTTAAQPKILFKIEVPAITSYPFSHTEEKYLFGQLTLVTVEVESSEHIFAENIVDTVDKHALAPVYSFLDEADEEFLINKIHSQKIDSVVLADEIKNEISESAGIDWCSVKCSNYGMLHPYSTLVSTEKNMWFPEDAYDE